MLKWKLNILFDLEMSGMIQRVWFFGVIWRTVILNLKTHDAYKKSFLPILKSDR